MMARRQLLGAGASLVLASRARAQSGLWPEWLGSYAGAVRFYRSIPLEDIYPPPEHPHVDLDDPAPFALYFAIRADGKRITTVEHLDDDGTLSPVQQAFIETGAFQCGFCTPGFVMMAHELLKVHPNPSDDEIRDGLEGNLCRCTGYENIVRAVRRAAQAGVSE